VVRPASWPSRSRNRGIRGGEASTVYVLPMRDVLTNVNIGSRRGEWGNRVSPRPRPAGEWGNRVSPFPHSREGLGGRSPPRNNRMFIAALCGAAAWTADAGSRPHYTTARYWADEQQVYNHSRRGRGEPRVPHPPARGLCPPKPSHRVRGWGTPVSPSPCSRALPSQTLPRAGGWGNLVPPMVTLVSPGGVGKPGFPIPHVRLSLEAKGTPP